MQSDAEACDLTQQTFYRWASKGHQMRDYSKVKSWLITTLLGEFLGSRWRTNRFPQVSVDQATHELPSISPTLVNDLDGDTAMAALMEVDDLYRASLDAVLPGVHSYQPSQKRWKCRWER